MDSSNRAMIIRLLDSADPEQLQMILIFLLSILS